MAEEEDGRGGDGGVGEGVEKKAEGRGGRYSSMRRLRRRLRGRMVDAEN